MRNKVDIVKPKKKTQGGNVKKHNMMDGNTKRQYCHKIVMQRSKDADKIVRIQKDKTTVTP